MTTKLAQKSLCKLLPVRGKTSNKTSGGVVLIVAGGAKFKGAGLLSALAATRTGAGYTHLMTDLVHYPWLKFPDFILHDFSVTALKEHRESVVAMGPGMGISKSKERLLRFLINQKIPKVVLDADALTMLSKMKIKKLPSTWILTPHEGELARLLGVSAKKIKKNRREYLDIAHQKFGCVVLLKGFETLIAADGIVRSFTHGTTALAKAGTGDVLLGIIAALYTQGLEAIEAASLGCLLHGEASKDWLKKGNDHLGLRPLDLIEILPKTIKRLRPSNQ